MTIISISLGVALAFYIDGIFNLPLYIITLIGSIALHAAANVANDYYDTKFGVDRPGSPTTRYRPHPIIAGFMEPGDLIKMTVALLAISLLTALYLSIVVGYLALVLGVLGGIFAMAYTFPPFTYKYRALGELFVFLCWGPIMVLGAYYVQTGLVGWTPIIVSSTVGLLVSAVLLANNIRDIEYDAGTGIKTLAILLGRDGALKLYAAMILSPYIIMFSLVAIGILGVFSLLVFITLPKALSLVRLIRREVPDMSDPMTAQLVLMYGILLVLGIAIPI